MGRCKFVCISVCAGNVSGFISNDSFYDSAGTSLQHEFKIMQNTAYCMGSLDLMGLAHHDIKPGNLGLEEFESEPLGYRVVLVNFGLSSRPDSGRPVLHAKGTGTVEFQAPEVAKGGNNSVKADMYSLGVTCLCIHLRLDHATLTLLSKDPCVQHGSAECT